MGVDWPEFSGAASYQADFSGESLNSLMNRLASRPDSVLVNQAMWERYNLNVGDTIDLRVETSGDTFVVRFTVVGVVLQFPTWMPSEDEALFIANLDYLFETWGALQPYDVWLRVSPAVNTQDILYGINKMGVSVLRVQDARAQLAESLNSSARRGVLGTLSIGFLASTSFTVLGFLSSVFFSLRERQIQLGAFRAIGLSQKKLRKALVTELACLTFLGLLVGTLVGVVASHAFIPYLPVSNGVGEDILPLVSQIDWGKIALTYIFLGATLLLGAIGLVLSLRRMKIFEAIKLGETT